MEPQAPVKCKLSLCMIVKNEEEYLPSCLNSVRGIADEIIVVDNGSTDSSVQVANRFGARIISHEWREDFSEARNISLDAATGDWIMVLDADEELAGSSAPAIKSFLERVRADGVEMIIRNELPQTDVAAYDELRIVRLFRNRKEYRYQFLIHEQIRPSIEMRGGRIVPSDFTILHHGYSHTNVQGGVDRAERNLRMLYGALKTSPDDPYLRYQLGSTLMSIGQRDEARKELDLALGLNYEALGPAVLDKLYVKISQLALGKNKYGEALEFARKSLQCNPQNSISGYVAAVSCLSMNQIPEGYGYLLQVRDNPKDSLRLRSQLTELILACEKALGQQGT